MFLGKCWKLNLNVQNWTKALCLGASEPTKRKAFRKRQGKYTFVKENKTKYLCKRNLSL